MVVVLDSCRKIVKSEPELDELPWSDPQPDGPDLQAPHVSRHGDITFNRDSQDESANPMCVYFRANLTCVILLT
jgi:hypothetical protein